MIVTRRGKPVAAIESLTEEDMEDYLLERSEKFWKMIEREHKGKSVSLESVRKKLEL